MTESKTMEECFMCGEKYQMGPHIYNGEIIHKYGIGVCRNCYTANWDGWAPHHEEKLIAHLKRMNLPIPERNDKGRLPRD